MLKRFYAVGSCALASHIALEEAGDEYEAVRLNFAANDQRKPEHLKVSPKGRVSALVTDAGILTETPAMGQAACDQAEAVAFASGLPWEAFGKDTESGGDTRAMQEIRQQMDKFKSGQDRLQAETAKLVQAAKSGDLGQPKSQFGATARACSACHDHFRRR